MARAPILASLLLPVLAVFTALVLAGGRPGDGPELDGQAAVPTADWRPQPVRVQAGWVVSAGGRHRPVFDVRNCPARETVYDLIPEKDQVAALTEPRFTTAAEADWLKPEAPVLGLKIGPEARCYPLAILNWHSLVHDRVQGQGLYIFWDPPSGLALARRTWAASRPLGMAGLGYRGTGLAYEVANGALWDLFDGRPLSFPGKPAGFDPKLAPDHQWLLLERMTWGAWQRRHGHTRVLSRDTGYAFDYSLDPYTAAATGPGGQVEDYWHSATLLAPENLRDASLALPDKEGVVGFLAAGKPWAVSLRQLAEAGRPEVTVAAADGPYRVRFWPQEDRCEVVAADGTYPPQLRLFWFAWKARFPQTRLWSAAVATD